MRTDENRPLADPGSAAPATGSTVRLACKPPFAWDAMLAYLRLRAVPGVEWVDGSHYRRTAAFGPSSGWLEVSMADGGMGLELHISAALSLHAAAIAVRVESLFDVHAEASAIGLQLREDPLLRPTVERLPGLRVAGAFDGFELAVRTVLGQQVSVKGASTIAGRWAAAFGVPIVTPFAALNRLSPRPETLASSHEDEIAVLGMVGARARCLIGLAKAVCEQRVNLSTAANVHQQMENLRALAGIGPWTAQYIAMRALHWADAFPTGDLMLMRAAGLKEKPLQRRAEGWRPWRAYAAHYLWQSLGVAA